MGEESVVKVSKSLVIMILISSTILLLLFSLLLHHNIGSVKDLGIKNFKTTDQVRWSVDRTEINNSNIAIEGWAFKPGEKISSYNIHILLRNPRTGKSYQLPSELIRRPDIEEQFGRNFNYSLSGFKAIANINNLKSLDKFQIYIAYHNNNANLYVSTGRTLSGKDEE